MRELIAFACEGETLLGTLDQANGKTGLLIVSGGNEIRAGAHRGMAWLAQALAARNVPVFRFDRRGIGDSTGKNGGYATSGPDIAAATAAFRKHAPHVRRLIALGTCDGATALVLHGTKVDVDGLILGNPWIIQVRDDLPPASAIEARYKQRLKDPAQWMRLLRGNISIAKLLRGLWRIVYSRIQESDTQREVFARLRGNETIILAQRDATALTFASEAQRHNWPVTIRQIDTASHSFARAGDREALLEAITAALASTSD